jgi:hypothetical protein
MQNVLSWAKGNPISIVSIIVVIVAIGVLTWVHLDGRKFTGQMGAQQDNIKQIDFYMTRRVEVPGKTPNDPPRNVGPLTINKPAIDQIKAVYAKMDGEYRQVFEDARRVNRAGHAPMLPNLFPVAQSSAMFSAKDEYPLILTRMLAAPGADSAAGLPALNAKPPLANEIITAELERIEQQFRSENAIPAQGGFQPDQFDLLRRLKSTRLREMMLDHAKTISMYAQTQPKEEGFPFHIPAWVSEGGTPNEVALWTGQMMLWIQQDLATAIALANEVGEPTSGVTDSVVKRLVSMRVVPGSVGIRNRGGFAMQPDNSTAFADPGMAPTHSADPSAAPALVTSADVRLPDDFSISPTGRSSNAIYDVWHVWVELVVDSQRMPSLFNAIAQVNFMTVLSLEVSNVDEYDALQQGYVYGDSDAVHVRMLVETIWLRDWTARLMPRAVKQLLGIEALQDG